MNRTMRDPAGDRHKSSCSEKTPESMTAMPTPAPLVPVVLRRASDELRPMVAAVRSSVAKAGRSAITRATRGSRASVVRLALSISATWARWPWRAFVATPRAERIARTSGAPWNSTMTRERPVI